MLGFEIWKALPPASEAPVQAVQWGLGAVLFAFVASPELQTAVSDGVLTLRELSSLQSLRIGYATIYSAVVHPNFGFGRINNAEGVTGH